VRLTSDGQELLPYMERFTQESNSLENAINNLKNNNNKVLRIASYSSITNHWLPTIISRFSNDFPNIKFEVHVGSLEEISDLVYNSEMDMGFISRQENIRCDWFHLCNDPMYAVLPPDSEVEGDNIPITFFEGKPFFMPTYGFDHDILNVLKIHGVEPRINPTAVDDATVVSMVSHGLGYSILPKLILSGMNNEYIAKPVFPASYRDLGIIVKSKDTMSAAAHKFVAYSKAVVKEMYEEYDD
jgi:DNA-binding transcriptional LysR family regulator